MKTSVITFLIGLFIHQFCLAQTVHHSVSLDIMTTAVSRSSLDSVPIKVTVPVDIQSSEESFSISEKESGKIFITGTPYDSIQVQIPSHNTFLNQYGERADLQDFQLMYGASEEVSEMNVVSPTGCVTFQMPDTGRIHIRLGGKLISDYNLRGIYTGFINLECKRE